MNEPVKLNNSEPNSLTAFAPGWAVIGVFIMMLVAGLAYARDFLMPVVLAILLQLVFSPVRRQLSRWGLPSGISAFVIVATLLTALCAGFYGLSSPVSDWVDRAPEITEKIQDKFRELQGATQSVREVAEQVDEISRGGESEDPGVQRVAVEEESGLVALALSLPGILAQVLFTLVLLFFLLASGDMFYEKIVHAMPTFRDKRTAIRIAFDIERKLSRYLFSISTINLFLGIAIGLAMWWLDMPSPVLFGILACLLNFIPYIGALIGVVIATAVGLATLDSLQEALLAGGLYFGLTTFEGQLVTPYFVGRSLRLNAVVVFLSVTLFAWLWSVVGMLVATPLLVTVRTFCEHIPSLYNTGIFLSERGAEAAPEKESTPTKEE